MEALQRDRFSIEGNRAQSRASPRPKFQKNQLPYVGWLNLTYRLKGFVMMNFEEPCRAHRIDPKESAVRKLYESYCMWNFT